jgi:soluble lytic murein transglycosylase
LLHLLEAVAREYAGDIQTAVTLLRSLELNTPLTYPGQASRARLVALGESVVPLRPAPNQAPPPVVSLPEPVKSLDLLGFSGASESALRTLEPDWLRDVEGDRYAVLCETYGQLSASRRRYVLGAAKASSVNFFNRPNERESWLWQCAYPNPYPEWVSEYTARWQVSPALVYAIMRQESGFHSSIESPARARGLMQIIPPTASRFAEELGEEVITGLMDSPRHNIRYGTYYLHKLLATFEQHPAPAIAAYNAGPYSAMRWRHATTELPVELFIARIPFDETRNYVQRVLANLRIYETLYPELGELDIPLNLSSNGVAADSPMSPSEIPVDPTWY